MTAQPNLRVVPATTDTLTPRWKARAEREADRRHRALVLLEELHRDTPWYCFRARRALHRAIVRHIGMGL
ncbi:hypothetical protein SEA_BRUHMOMENT_109 [Arthrobacter phage BruhMoment]|nr:hypothetical protein SEA_BRUHMOMENT_109 [Arthrobacter phage BruhMoment]